MLAAHKAVTVPSKHHTSESDTCGQGPVTVTGQLAGPQTCLPLLNDGRVTLGNKCQGLQPP